MITEYCNDCDKIKSLQREIEVLKEQIERYRYDALTGLPTRIDFESDYENHIHDYNTFNETFMLGIIDLNDLHNINKDKGYKAGDSALLEVSQTLQELFFDCSIYRIGGDEFALLCRRLSLDKFTSIINHSNINCKVSIGACKSKGVNISKSDMFKIADDLMLIDKSNKRVGRLNCKIEFPFK